MKHKQFKIKEAAKQWLDANLWDGENREHATADFITQTPAELQETVFDMLDDILPRMVSVDEVMEIRKKLIEEFSGQDWTVESHGAICDTVMNYFERVIKDGE